MTLISRYVKAIAAFIGGILAVWGVIAADKNISFTEIGYAKTAFMGLIAALVTAISPKNRTE